LVYNWEKSFVKELNFFMIIDLHIHSKTCSDGSLSVKEIIQEAKTRNIDLLSITDHDSIACQKNAWNLAKKNSMHYICGVELNVIFSHPEFFNGKSISLDLLGYSFDLNNKALAKKLQEFGRYRKERAEEILKKINTEFQKEGITNLDKKDLIKIENSINGVLGRPHIADYLVTKGIVKNRQEAFDKYLVKCDVAKYPLYIDEGSTLIKKAGGIVVLAHPNDPHGTSLIKFTNSIQAQTKILEDYLLPCLDGIECWHSRNDVKTTNHYLDFSKKHGLIVTGGSDCHQNPIIMGTVKVPDYVADQFL
jgi:predicted metal-dependent phosphoesterase TrpH